MNFFLVLLSLGTLYSVFLDIPDTINFINSQEQPLITQNPIVFPHKIMITLSLSCREENLPPLGITPPPNRDIGFATVFLQLENNQESTVKVMIKNIEIQNVSDHQLQDFEVSPQEIELKPLEYSEIDFHLTNKTGYFGQAPVKAIVTYQIGQDIYTIESDPVIVERN